MIEFLLEHGGDPNIKTHTKFTPLHLTAEQSLTEVVESFLNHGADVSAICSHGYTPLVVSA